MADQLNSSFEEQRVLEIIDLMQAVLQPEMDEHIQRWRTMGDSIQTWEQNLEVLREFTRNRPQFVRKHIQDSFNLDGTASITLQADQARGYVQVNTLAITNDTPGVVDPSNWTGEYFMGVPIRVTAVPYPGYQFAGWQERELDNPLSELTLTLTGDLTLQAIFKPLP